MKKLDKILGSIFGGAIGDALGYEIEFMTENGIFKTYGKDGIKEYSKTPARFSDDTQMTLFTANGLLLAEDNLNKLKKNSEKSIVDADMRVYTDYIAESYKAWYITQQSASNMADLASRIGRSIGNENIMQDYWLLEVDDLYALRAPGNTCLSAISSYDSFTYGTVNSSINNSKGCGGVMRVAPCGLLFDCDMNDMKTVDKIAMLGAEAAAITHGHPLGFIPAAAMTYIINRVANCDDVSLKHVVIETKDLLPRLFGNTDDVKYMVKLITDAIFLSETDRNPLACIHELGEGWVGEEALAIALYAAMKYEDDFEKALIVSVNHKGDSDSTGAIMGNILGAYLGFDKIPKKYIDGLEMQDVLYKISTKIYGGTL